MSSGIIPRGKYRGQHVSSLSDAQLHCVWAGLNGNRSRKINSFLEMVLAEQNRRHDVQRSPDAKTEAEKDPLISFGMYRGKPLSFVPDDYLEWCLKKFHHCPERIMFDAELRRRHPCRNAVNERKEKKSKSRKKKNRSKVRKTVRSVPSEHDCDTERDDLTEEFVNMFR